MTHYDAFCILPLAAMKSGDSFRLITSSALALALEAALFFTVDEYAAAFNSRAKADELINLEESPLVMTADGSMQKAS